MTVTINGSGSITEEITIDGVKVGQGGGNVSTNTAVGASALAANEAGGTNNTAVGYQALDANTTGDANTAVGDSALGANTTAGNNTAVGASALAVNTTGGANTALGNLSLNANTTANHNVGVGYISLYNNTTGLYNVGVGSQTLYSQTDAEENVAIGYQAGYSNTTNNQVFIGYLAGYSCTTGGNATLVGNEAGNSLTTGSENTFIGQQAGKSITTGSKNTILGRYNGNGGGLDIRTASNYIVLSDGDGFPRVFFDSNARTVGGLFSQYGRADMSSTSTTATYGFALNNDGFTEFKRVGSEVLRVNRVTDDGTLVAFYQDGSQEGTISVSGNTVSYNAFAGSHWSQLSDGSKPEILRGTVMESINELVEWPNEPRTERLCRVKISDTAGSKKVYGVFMAWDNDWLETNDMYITAVGAFVCRVNGNVVVQEGDLLESNGDGTARVQADDVMRSSTIGKVTCTEKTHQYDDGSYCVPTVLYCG